VNRPPRSRIRNLRPLAFMSVSMRKLRAAWVVHGPGGVGGDAEQAGPISVTSVKQGRRRPDETAFEGTWIPRRTLPTIHQDERQMSVKILRRASFQRQDIARNGHNAHTAHRPTPLVRPALPQVQGSPRTPHGG
jgi:hypothetical protein